MSSRTRDQRILEAALNVAIDRGLPAITRLAVATRAGMSTSSVMNYKRDTYMPRRQVRAGTMETLRRDVVTLAVERETLAVVLQALVAGYDEARAAPEGLRARALAGALAQPETLPEQ